MSYINQDPDIACDARMLVPFKGKQVVSVTQSAWLVDQAREEGLSSLAACSCWCGCCPGSCVDCQEADEVKPRINISSGEDATWSAV